MNPSAIFSPGGFASFKPAIYIISISGLSQKYVYGGRTRTSNHTGTSAPFSRLATHLKRSGNTHSCIWKNLDTLSSEDFDKMSLSFCSSFISEKYIEDAERLLIWHLSQQFLMLNRKIPKTEPRVLSCIQEKVISLIKESNALRRFK